MRSSLESKHSQGDTHRGAYLHTINSSNSNSGGGNNSGGGQNNSSKADRQELVESPQSKMAYKDFYRNFRALERDSVDGARKYAEDSLHWMPERAKWRVLLELADLSKRANDFEQARELYAQVRV